MAKNTLIVFMIFMFTWVGCTVNTEDNVNPTDARDKFLGTWSVSETCTRLDYDVVISLDPGNSSQVLVSNFAASGSNYDPAVALVTSNTIYVSSQTVGEGWSVNGTGTYQTNGTITWTYHLNITGTDYNCTAIYK